MSDLLVAGDTSSGGPSDFARAALSLALDGGAPPSPVIALEAYRVARVLVESRWASLLRALDDAPDGALCVIGSGSDNIEQLLHATGVRFTQHGHLNAAVEGAAIACLGCPRAASTLDDQRLLNFIWNGGLLITSDHAVALPALRRLLPLAGRGAPRRARARRVMSESGALLPVVFMPAGYDRLAPLPDSGAARALATDALTGEPLVVFVPLGAGALLHAVPHWYQDTPVNLTDVERRPALGAPAYAELKLAHPDVTVGDLQAAETMLGLLLEGITMARASRTEPITQPIPRVGTTEHA